MYRDKVCELEKREIVGEYDKDSERDKTKREDNEWEWERERDNKIGAWKMKIERKKERDI